jgi:hypothetical protein
VLQAGFTLPSERDAHRLIDLVWSAAPCLAPPHGDDEKREIASWACWAAFLGVACMPRIDKIDTKFDRLIWRDRCASMLSGTSFAGTEISLRDFTTATLMHGADLLHSFHAGRFPYDLSWSFGNHAGRSASDRGWRGVLAAGHISAAVPVPLSKLPPVLWRFLMLFEKPLAELLYLPLLNLQGALHDLDQNTVVPLLRPVPRTGRSVSTNAGQAIRGAVAGAVRYLVELGLTSTSPSDGRKGTAKARGCKRAWHRRGDTANNSKLV